ncbi:MAG TPA: TIGR00730 family Rossman fold protein [Saprospiraceae bacterium]|nr:TIGR00730 family Rossman fold protein [Saprospiraceae bacterium]HMP22496.1 TIGR00730 family Rossman fold protein [Saprospiraceae bacterium]
MTEPVKILNPSEYQYLEGPKSRTTELRFVWGVFWQFLKGLRALHFVGPCITVFGSARFREGHPYYEKAREVGKAIAASGFTTMTGGGPGIMEAANRGAYEHSGRSVGVNIQLPHEQFPNPYMHKHITLKYFFVRKVLLLKYSYAFIVLPGGWGTMDEMFETLTLVQTGVIHDFPVVLLGTDYYSALMEYLHFMEAQGTISPEDLKLIKLTDDIGEAMDHIRAFILDNYEVKNKRHPLWWLLERE